MMEFTMSRVVMAICGLMIMAVAIGPFTSFYDQRLDQAGIQTVEEVANLFDKIASKGDNVSYLIHGHDILPSPNYYLKINGNEISLQSENGKYSAFTAIKINSQQEVIISYDDTMIMSIHSEDGFQYYCLEKVSDILTNASMNVLMSSASL